MEELKKVLNALKTGLNEEIQSMKRLGGQKLITFSNIFNIPDDSILYYNEYNLMITDPDLNEILGSYFKKKNLIFSINFPEYNSNFWVYQYFNDQLFSIYLD